MIQHQRSFVPHVYFRTSLSRRMRLVVEVQGFWISYKRYQVLKTALSGTNVNVVSGFLPLIGIL
jgi:hypothetical protein